MNQEIRTGTENQILVDRGAQFRTTLDLIQSRHLTPDNIDSYAASALSDLISLSNTVAEEYLKENEPESDSWKELEDEAFAHFGLDNLGQVLDHVASVDEQMRMLDNLIQNVPQANHILVPPRGEMQPISPGEEDFGKRATISRTKTVLYILANDFGIDVADGARLSLTSGTLSDQMMRRHSYFLIMVPELKRSMLICDEEGNVSYVFSNDALERKEISPEDLAKFGKNEINSLLESDPNLGRRVIYTINFVDRIFGLMTDLDYISVSQRNGGEYLRPKAPEGVLSLNKLAISLGIDYQALAKTIEENKEQLGEIHEFRFGNRTARGYTPEHQAVIRKALESKGFFKQSGDETVANVRMLARKWGIGDSTVRTAIDELGDTLGEIGEYRFKTVVTKAYTLEQAEKIRKQLESKGIFSAPAPEGILNIVGLATDLGVVRETVLRAIEALGEDLGEAGIYRFNTVYAKGYNPSQQELIKQKLKEMGMLNEFAPEEVLSTTGVAKKLGVAPKTVNKVAERLGNELGVIRTYRFAGSGAYVGYNLRQQERIEQELISQSEFVQVPPEGVTSIKGLREELGIGRRRLKMIISALGEQLGEVHKYKFNNNVTDGYNPAQVEMIKQAIEQGL